MTTAALTPDELLTTTRSVRRRLDLTRPVPTELIRECVQIALQAPSGSNRQGWHWLVVTDQEQRRRIGGFYQHAVQRYLASAGSAARLFADDPDRAAVQQRVGASVAWLGERMGLAARARGLGSARTTLHLRYEREIAELLGVPDGVHKARSSPRRTTPARRSVPPHVSRWTRSCTSTAGRAPSFPDEMMQPAQAAVLEHGWRPTAIRPDGQGGCLR